MWIYRSRQRVLLGGYARAHSQVGVSVGLVKQAWINRSRHCVWSIEYACVRSLAGGWDWSVSGLGGCVVWI